MKKGFKQYTTAWAALLILFNLVCFVTPAEVDGFNKFGGSFWAGYAVITLAFLGQLACAYKAFRAENAKKFFYNLPLITVSYTGLILTLILGGLCMAIPDVPNWLGAIVGAVVLAFTAGTAMMMWLGEQITEFGIGNGISMILFANIISSIPGMVGTLATLVWWQIIIVLVGIVALVLFIVFINDAERRIPIQYAKRVVGRKVYGGQNTNLPIKVAMSGVMPIIFAQSICSLPATICAFTGKTSGWWYDHVWSSSSWIYAVIYFIMIFFFSWFYSTIQYDTVEISNNLKSNGGFIPGFRPGKPTADFIQKVINKIIVFGSVYLGIVALLPIIAGNLMEGVKNLAIGGTSVIIVVGVALETVKALEAQMLMRHYKGFLD